MVAQRLSLILNESGLGLHKSFQLSSNLLNFFSIGELWEEEDGAWLGKFGGGLGWWKLLKKLGLGGLFWAQEKFGWFLQRDYMFASKDYAAAVSRPRSGVPVALAGYGNKALFKDMVRCLTVWTTRIVNWWWVDLVDIGWLFCFQSLYSPH